jgi:hypothetical protein
MFSGSSSNKFQNTFQSGFSSQSNNSAARLFGEKKETNLNNYSAKPTTTSQQNSYCPTFDSESKDKYQVNSILNLKQVHYKNERVRNLIL